MTKEGILQCEARRLSKFDLLPNYFKIVAVVLMVLSLITIIILKTQKLDYEILRSIAKNGILVSLLIYSISMDKIEDELTSKLRAQSFSWAFVIGVIYTIIHPYIVYLLRLWLKPEKAILGNLDVFIILWFMLYIQIMVFHVLKAAR